MLEVDAFWASRLLLEVTHDMLVDAASDVLEDKTVDELKTCEGLSSSPVSSCFHSMSSSVRSVRAWVESWQEGFKP